MVSYYNQIYWKMWAILTGVPLNYMKKCRELMGRRVCYLEWQRFIKILFVTTHQRYIDIEINLNFAINTVGT